MDINELVISDGRITVWLGLKIATIIGLLFYLIFALVVVRQVKHMTETLEVGFEGVIILASWLHFFFAIGTLVAAFVIL